MEPVLRTLTVLDLSEEDCAALANTLPPDTVRFEQETGAGSHGRDVPTALAIITASGMALRALALWITRHTTRNESEISIQTQNADGSSKTIHIRSKSASSQAEADVLKQLAAVCKMDVKDLDPGDTITSDQ